MNLADWRVTYTLSASLCIAGFLVMTLAFGTFHHYGISPPAPYWFIGLALFLVGIILFIFPPVSGHRFRQETKNKTHIETIFPFMVTVFILIIAFVYAWVK